MHWENRLQAMQHQSLALTQVTRVIRRYRQHRMLCAVPCELSGGGPCLSWHHNSRPRPMKETRHSRYHSTVLPRLGASRKPPESAHTRSRFNYQAPGRQQSTEGTHTLNSGQGTETEPNTTMHSLPATFRTLPSIAGLQV